MNLKKVREFLHNFSISPGNFIFPAILSLLAALCEGVSVGALIPTAKGIINMDFSFVKKIPALKDILAYLAKFIHIDNTAIFVILIIIIFLAALLKNILQFTSSLMISSQVRKIAYVMREEIFRKYLSLGKLFFDKSNTGHLQTVLLTYVNMVINRIRGAELALAHLFFLLVYFCIMFIISFRLTVFVCIFVPVVYYAMKWIIDKIKQTSRAYSVYFVELSKKVANILSCITLVKLYTSEEKEAKRFALLNSGIAKIEYSLDKKSNLAPSLQEVILLIAILSLISLMSFIVVKEKTGEVASFLVYLYILRMALKSFQAFSNLVVGWATVKGPVSEISKLLDDRDKIFVTGGSLDFIGLKDRIELRNLNFSYIPGQPVLKDLSLAIEKGKFTALAGPSGSGKTTIVNLILRLYDCPPGSIFVDGEDIRNFTLSSLMKQAALVAQDTLLFNDTLRNNIVYGLDRTVSDEELFVVLKKARLYDFVIGLQEGLDTFIGDKGMRLSGGEKQRVSIARAILKDAGILILDEATSSLDTITEKLIQDAIEEVVKGRTTIVIAHRLSTIKKADKILLIENGRLVEGGTPEELINKNGRFYEYWHKQLF